MEILKCETLTKYYGTGNTRVSALKGLDLSVKKGEFIAVTGPSGSGKSTLLHLIGGVDRPSDGKIKVEGVDITGLNKEQAAVFRRRKVGLVYQFYNLIPTLDVRRNIMLPMLIDRRKPEEAYFNQIVTSLGLEDRLDFLPGKLSGGQQQRTAIARSLLYQPALLLADEPTGNIDRKNSGEIVELLKLSNRNLGQTILLVTHDESIALEADRNKTIEDGGIVSDKAVR